MKITQLMAAPAEMHRCGGAGNCGNCGKVGNPGKIERVQVTLYSASMGIGNSAPEENAPWDGKGIRVLVTYCGG